MWERERERESERERWIPSKVLQGYYQDVCSYKTQLIPVSTTKWETNYLTTNHNQQKQQKSHYENLFSQLHILNHRLRWGTLSWTQSQFRTGYGKKHLNMWPQATEVCPVMQTLDFVLTTLVLKKELWAFLLHQIATMDERKESRWTCHSREEFW